MKYIILIPLVYFISSCAGKPSSKNDVAIKDSSTINLEVLLKEFWDTSKANIYPKKLEDKYFTQTQFDQLQKAARSSQDIYEYSNHLSAFLKKLKVSHTHFYTDQNIEFYFFRSLFSTHTPDNPEIAHLGADYQKTDKGYVIRTTLEGFGAQQAGLQRGDIILEANGKPFHPVLSFKNFKKPTVKTWVQRGDQKFESTIKVTYSGLHRSYLNAIKNSVKVLNVANKKIGYVHLWTGTHEDSNKALTEAVKNLRDTDALILDLRDGYGGAWWNHLDPFFRNTQTYFKATWVERDGKTSDMLPEVKENPDPYLKPMVVLINEGVRSGKEALAFQFKKSKRAKLVGTKTAGFFTAGGAYFREMERPYFLYLSSKGLLLDGVDIEGKGVSPDIIVPYPLKSQGLRDPQLERAIEILSN